MLKQTNQNQGNQMTNIKNTEKKMSQQILEDIRFREQEESKAELQIAFSIGYRDGVRNWTPTGFMLSEAELRNAYLDGHSVGMADYNYEDPDEGYHPQA